MSNKIRLTESQIKAIIENSVRRIIAENEEDEWGNIFTQDGRNQWKNLGNSINQGVKAGSAAMRGNYQAGQDKTELYGANANVDAEKRLRDVDNACRELRNQYTKLLAQRKELEAYCQRKGLATLTRKPFKRNQTQALPINGVRSRFDGTTQYNTQTGGYGQ